MSNYTYNISQTLYSRVVPEGLKQSIERSSITAALDNPFPISVGETTFTITFKTSLSESEETVLNELVTAHDGSYTEPDISVSFSSSVPKTIDGRIRTALEKSNDSKYNQYSPDWCDRTTWYPDSVYVVDEVPSTNDNITYQLAHTHIIDTYHGKIMNEDALKDKNNISFRVVVHVNDDLKTEKDPHYDLSPTDPPGYDWDYTVDYRLGQIIFKTALDPGDSVEVSYHYATTSTFYVTSPPGVVVEIDYVECQFSSDIELKDSITFEAFGLVDYFAPFLIGMGYSSGDKIFLGTRFVYKSMRDYLADSAKSYPRYQNLAGTSGWRGLPCDIQVFSWDYVRATPLNGDAGMEIRIRLEKDVELGGTYASVTFYCGTNA